MKPSIKNFSTLIFPAIFYFFWIAPMAAQKLPASNMYLFEFKEQSDSVFLFSKPAYLTAFNAQGYNNQPFFINKEELYFTVQFSDDTTQTDIFGLHLSDKTLTQITATPESEYSPQMVPSIMEELRKEDFIKLFSCIRVEMDGSTQRLWEYPLDRSDNGRPTLEGLDNMGYYLWVAQNALAVFLVGDPHHLAMVNKLSSRKKNVTSNIGRCLQPMPKGKVAFVHKTGSSWLIKELDPRSNRTTLLTAVLPGSEDFVALPDGTLFMGNGSKLYKFHKGTDNGWQEVADFAYYGIHGISRLAVKGNRIVLVNQK